MINQTDRKSQTVIGFSEYGKEMVDYLTPFIDPELFIAKYELQLPSKEKIQDFLIRENIMKR